MIDLYELYRRKDLYFNHLYHLTLEKIKKFYHRLNGLPEISTSKTLKLYLDTTGYRERIFKVNPEKEFLTLYIKALDLYNIMTPEEKINAIQQLYDYTKKDIYLNDQSYRIHIKSKN